jgi:cell division protein FtsB
MPSEPRRTPSRGPRPRGRSGPGRLSSGSSARLPRITAAPGGGAAAVPRRSRITGRAVVLVLVLSLLTISYASSMKAYLQQRSQITGLQHQIALREAKISDLEREKRRWQDPAYVRAQARELNYVMPGETSYVVLDEDGKALDQQSTLSDPESVIAPKEPTAWWSTAWKSVELAGNPPKPDPEPAKKLDKIGD